MDMNFDYPRSPVVSAFCGENTSKDYIEEDFITIDLEPAQNLHVDVISMEPKRRIFPLTRGILTCFNVILLITAVSFFVAGIPEQPSNHVESPKQESLSASVIARNETNMKNVTTSAPHSDNMNIKSPLPSPSNNSQLFTNSISVKYSNNIEALIQKTAIALLQESQLPSNSSTIEISHTSENGMNNSTTTRLSQGTSP